jgi:hypothetical protein
MSDTKDILEDWPYGDEYPEFKEKREGYIALIDISGLNPPRWVEIGKIENQRRNLQIYSKGEPNPEVNRSLKFNTK